MAYCLSSGDFIGANDGEKSCVVRQPTYNANMIVISRAETSLFNKKTGSKRRERNIKVVDSVEKMRVKP